MRPTPRFFGALALAAAIFYYGGSSNVAWLYLLTYWIAGLIVAAFIYAYWNWKRLYGEFAVTAVKSSGDSPVSELSESFLRGGPFPAPIFEGDRLDIELALRTRGGARGPARISGLIGGAELSAASGLVPKTGWKVNRELGPVARGPVLATAWVLEATDPLGLFRYRRPGSDSEAAVVLPRFTSLTSRPQVRELEANVAAPRAGSGTELFGVREYRPGDPLRRIHWRSSARHGQLVVREFEPPGVRTVGIFCDPKPPSREVADQIARLAASEAWDCIRDGGRVLLWSPGFEPSRPDESRSLWALLEWLARYPELPAQGGAVQPGVVEAVAVLGGASAPILQALDDVRQQSGAPRAWVVGQVAVDFDGPVQRVGTKWPL